MRSSAHDEDRPVSTDSSVTWASKIAGKSQNGKRKRANSRWSEAVPCAVICTFLRDPRHRPLVWCVTRMRCAQECYDETVLGRADAGGARRYGSVRHSKRLREQAMRTHPVSACRLRLCKIQFKRQLQCPSRWRTLSPNWLMPRSLYHGRAAQRGHAG